MTAAEASTRGVPRQLLAQGPERLQAVAARTASGVLVFRTLMGAPRDRILEIVRDFVNPLVRADGGQIYVVAVAERTLALHLTGRFSGCPGNTLAKRRVLEPLPTARFPDLKVEITSGPLIPKGAELL